MIIIIDGRWDGSDIIYMDGLRRHKYWSDINLLLKWTSICVTADLDANHIKIAINGDLNATKELKDNRNLRDKFTGDSTLPMTVRLGNYYFDKQEKRFLGCGWHTTI